MSAYADALVLNANYNAIQICDWKKSISLLWQGACQAVDKDTRAYNFKEWSEISAEMEAHPGGFVHTATLKIAVPEVIRLTKYDRLPKADVKFNRNNLYQHYKGLCCYCGNKFNKGELNLDHVIPRSRGGLTNWNNIVTSCYPCNTRKDNRTPNEAGMALLVPPSKPRWRGHQDLIVTKLPIKIRESWQNWLDKAYWDIELEHD